MRKREGRVVLSHQTGVRTPVALPLLFRRISPEKLSFFLDFILSAIKPN